MVVTGRLGSPSVLRKSPQGREYFTFRLAEHFGRAPNQETVWYDVYAFVPASVGDHLRVGQRVKVQGKLAMLPYVKQDKSLGARARILAFSVEPEAA